MLPAAMANPFLGGGAGEGILKAELEIAGPVGAIEGRVELAGPGAGFFFVSPYTVKIDSPRLAIRFDGSGAATLSGEAQVNDGAARFEGETVPGGGFELRTRLEGVRALLDYGLRAVLDGDLTLALAPSGGGGLSGRLTVDRGELTRPISLHGEVLSQVLAPVDLLGTEESPLEAIALDLSLETREGVRIRNNLADLKVRWEPLTIRGNLLLPTIEGQLEVDPGGLIYAYGQTVRLDSAALVYAGEPGETPTMEVETTTSLEDPTIGRLAGSDPFRTERGGDTAASPEAVATDLAAYLGEQLAGSLSESLGGARISFRPLLIFGEADPSARLTLSRDVSAFATLAASIDLRNAERQTYLLDLHEFEAAPFLTSQLFSNDFGNEGATLQQRLQFGGARSEETGPRIRRLRVDRPPGIGRRALRRAVGYRKGDRLPDGGAFEVEVELAELLRRRGYPDARVEAAVAAVEGRPRVDLEVAIDSGPRVEFVFTGERLPAPLRGAVTALYRGGFYEPVTLEEMRTQALRAWRSRGHLEPEVVIERQVLSGGPPEQRRITLHSDPGRRVEPGPPEFVGLAPPEAADLAALFATPLQRVELAAGLPAAERRVRSGLAALGYPDAAIAERQLSADGRLLRLWIEPGERLRIGAIELVYEGSLRTEVEEAGGLTAGSPVRADRLARAALEVERELRESGYVDAEARLRLVQPGPEQPYERTAVFEVERGSRYRVAGTGFEGLGATRGRWAAARVAGLEEGEPLRPSDLRAARRRLYGTGLFSVVGSRTEPDPEGRSQIVFEVAERPRYRLAYGLRWESEEGTSLVVDLLDRNFLGRGVDVGLRALWSEDIQRLRLSATIPGLLGPRSSLGLFALGEEEEELVDDDEILQFTRTAETTLQLGWQFGPRSTGRLYGRYREVLFRETFLVEDPLFGFPDPIEFEIRRPFLGLQFLYDTRDEQAAPRRGMFGSVDFSFSDEALGGDLRYARLFGQLNTFRPAGRLAGRELTWAQSVRLGRAEAFDEQQITSDQLLLAGGEYSVRGYRRETVGPPELRQVRPRGIQTNSLLVLNEELRFEIWDPVSGLLFVDAGNVWITDRDFDFDLFASVGFGIRARTPFGLLRLDLAYPLDGRPGVDPEYKLYLGLGNVF